MLRPIRFEDWGRLPYRTALQRQLALVAERQRGAVGDTLVAVEHPPTITLGRNAPESDVTASQEELERRGIELVRSDRGGRATYHGPGQVVVYPIVALAEHGLGVKAWVGLLEDVLIDVLASREVRGERACGRPGIWTDGAKIASIGLRIAEGVSYHGVSLNVASDETGFDCIVTCGVPTERVTSIARETGSASPVAQVAGEICSGIATRLAAGGR